MRPRSDGNLASSFYSAHGWIRCRTWRAARLSKPRRKDSRQLASAVACLLWPLKGKKGCHDALAGFTVPSFGPTPGDRQSRRAYKGG